MNKYYLNVKPSNIGIIYNPSEKEILRSTNGSGIFAIKIAVSIIRSTINGSML